MFDAVLGDLAGTALEGVFNANQADKNRDFQRVLSNTSHQREVKDLEAAGLNPVLSARYGGASTPSGSTASVSAPHLGSTITNARVAKKNIEHLDAQIAATNAQTLKTGAETRIQGMIGNAMQKVGGVPLGAAAAGLGLVGGAAGGMARLMKSGKSRVTEFLHHLPAKPGRPSVRVKSFGKPFDGVVK